MTQTSRPEPVSQDKWNTFLDGARSFIVSFVPDQTYAEMFPDGRVIFYEGDDPDGFVHEIKTTYGFDPSADENWARDLDKPRYGFKCPAEHLDAICGSDRCGMGI